MPQNKNAVIRYQALDRCFSDFRHFRHRYYIDDLIDACAEALIEYTEHDSVSRRTVFDDIIFMESEQGWSIPLERHKDGKKVYYRYKSRDFSINPQFRSIIPCEVLLYSEVTFLDLSIDMGIFWGSWVLHKHKIPHPNQWRSMITTKK